MIRLIVLILSLGCLMFFNSCNPGCTDVNACNFDPEADKDDGSCEFLSCISKKGGCTDRNADNYDPSANVENGTCFFLGCTNSNAINYDPNATKDNDKCILRSEYIRLEQSSESFVIPNQRVVRLAFQAKDFDFKGVPNLELGNFYFLENGDTIGLESKPSIAPDTIPFKISSVLLIDVSSSVEGLVGEIKEAVKSLVRKKIDNQEFAIYTFDSSEKLLIDFSSDSAALIAAINTIQESNLLNSTNLYGSIQNTIPLISDTISATKIVDGSMIIFTDGRHNANQISKEETKEKIGDKKVFVSALNGEDLRPEDLKFLVGDDRYFEAQNINELENTFSEIQDLIDRLSRSIYLLNYQSPISDNASVINTLDIGIRNNPNTDGDAQIKTTFNSQNFGKN
jgi:hypothetical protein